MVISQSAATARVLREEPGLQEQWRSIVQARRRDRYRQRWNLHRDSHPSYGVKELRLLEPSIFAWLYRNDRSWLTTAGSPPTVGRRGNHASVAWDQRDRHLAAAIETAALDLRLLHPEKPLRRAELIESVPELATRIHTLDRLPLTLRAMALALASGKRQPTSGQMQLV